MSLYIQTFHSTNVSVKKRDVVVPVSSGSLFYLDAGNPLSYPGSGSGWKDLSGNNKSTTLFNAPSFSNGELFFNRASSQYAITYLTSSYNQANMTTTLWVKPAEDTMTAGMSICSDASGPNSLFGNVLGTTSGLVRSHTYDGGGKYVNSSFALSKNVWYNLSLVHTANSMIVYVNGASVGQTSLSGAQDTNRLYFMYPSHVNVGMNQYFSGSLAIVQTYNRALSAAETLQNFNAFRGRFGV